MELIYFAIVGILLLAGLFSVGFGLTLVMAAKRGDALRTQCFDQLEVERNPVPARLKESVEKLGELEHLESALMDQLAHFIAIEGHPSEKGIATSA